VNGNAADDTAAGPLVGVCALSAVAIGIWLRWIQASGTYLNPDEAILFFAGSADTLDELRGNIFRSQHAPLFTLLLHFVQQISSSEMALRLVPLAAGSLFPWVVFKWLGMVWSRTAGLAALVILTLSPPLVSLGAQARGYTLVLLLASCSLYCLDTGIARRSAGRVIVSAVCGGLALLTEYSAAFFVGGAALYFLLRVRQGIPGRLIAVWIIGQGVLGALCLGLYWTLASQLLAESRNVTVMNSAFSGAYRAPNQSLAAFLAAGTARQFSYALGSHAMGALAMLAFVVGLWRLSQARQYALAVLLSSPLVLAWGGALLSHPFGRSRHTAVLSLFIVGGVAIGLERFLTRRTAPAVIAALGTVVYLTGWTDVSDITPSRHRLESMRAGIAYLRDTVPPDGVLLTDGETALILQYYLRDRQHTPVARRTLREAHFGQLHLVSNGRWDFENIDRLAADIAWLRELPGAGSKRSIWIADGGFAAFLRSSLRVRYPQLVIPDERDFDGALQVFRLPSEL